MCGRFVRSSSLHDISKEFGLEKISLRVEPSYNIAPGQDIALIITDVARRMILCRWGFLPLWTKEPSTGHTMINARAETAADKPSFKSAFKRGRGVIVADGFYEWRKRGRARSPVYVHLKSGRPFGMAGIYSFITSPEGDKLCTCAIMTTEANALIRGIHNRMPVILTKEKAGLWLDPEVSDRDKLLGILTPYPSEGMVAYNVSDRVNSPGNDSPENIRPCL
jgi:putative SOS response-associated peptidase YedK